MSRAGRPPEAPDFDAMYRQDPDPWQVGSSWYERRKLAVLLASLPLERYAGAWEPGCGPGLTSRALAGRTDRLLATDASQVAVDLARDRCADLEHVHVTRSVLPERPVAEPVDLVVAAEFLYYLPDLPAALEALWQALAPGGHLVLQHWAHLPHDAHLSGPDVHALVAEQARARGARTLVRHRDADFLLDVHEVAR